SPAPVVLHAHGLRAGALSALAVRGRRGRLVVTLLNRTVGSRAGRAVGAVLLRILARTADTVLAVSPDLAEAARRAGAGDVRHAVIPAPAPRGRRGRLVVTRLTRPVCARAGRAVAAVLPRLLARTADTVLAVSPDLAEAARRAGAGDVRHAVIPAPAPAGPVSADPVS